MTDLGFSALWEKVDFSLHKLNCILKGAAAVGENADQINDDLAGLVYIAIDQLKATREQLDALRLHVLTLAKETEQQAHAERGA